jgi:hypothetical protein
VSSLAPLGFTAPLGLPAPVSVLGGFALGGRRPGRGGMPLVLQRQ